jgi:hypothetical protein
MSASLYATTSSSKNVQNLPPSVQCATVTCNKIKTPSSHHVFQSCDSSKALAQIGKVGVNEVKNANKGTGDMWLSALDIAAQTVKMTQN